MACIIEHTHAMPNVSADAVSKARAHAETINLGYGLLGQACYDEHGDPIPEPDQFTVAAIEIEVRKRFGDDQHGGE